MKLLRYGPQGQEKPGLLDREGNVRDLSRVLPDLTAEQLCGDCLRRLSQLDLATLPEPVLFTKAISCLSGPNDGGTWDKQTQRVIAGSHR
jgi:hypothetical protein